jgi:hypothetical protein
MQVTRKIAAAAAVATVATLGLATVVSANMIDDTSAKANSSLADAASVASKVTKATDGNGGLPQWYWVTTDGSLVAITGGLVGPFQGCQNFVPVDGVGGQVPVTDITGVVGLLSDGSSVTAVKTCVQDSTRAGKTQANKWYRMGTDGLLSVSRSNVGPFNVCHNEIPVTGLGDQVPLSDLASLMDLGNVDNSTDVLKTCEQLTQSK